MGSEEERGFTFRFERLGIWRKSADFVDLVYELTGSFPREEQFGMTSQVRRAAVSISGNIAEGSSRASKKEFSRFIEIAFGSLCETVSHLQLAMRQGFLAHDKYLRAYGAAKELSVMMSAFRNGLGSWRNDGG